MARDRRVLLRGLAVALGGGLAGVDGGPVSAAQVQAAGRGSVRAGAPSSPSTAPAASPRVPSWEHDPVRTYVRVVSDLSGADTWKWFSGRLHAALPEGEIVPLLGFDSVIRRKAGPFDPASVTISFSEATVFRDVASGEILDEWRNPLTGRLVRPLHYPEGPNPLTSTPASFAPGGGFSPWVVSDGTARFTRESRTDSPHPLDPAVWKLESSGPRFRALTLRSYTIPLDGYADPACTALPADYSLTVLSGWFPWMLLGQRPGQMLWQAEGRKVATPDAIPPDVRARIVARFPGLFEPVVPWKGPMSFMRWHMEQRRPET
jgi:hypothetical protein